MGGALLERPLPADLGIIFYLFFSSNSAMAFIILSWSMAALTNSLYDRLAKCIRRSYRDGESGVVQDGLFLIHVNVAWPVLSKRVELPHVVKYTMVPLLKV
jgi:hypothetical protein